MCSPHLKVLPAATPLTAFLQVPSLLVSKSPETWRVTYEEYNTPCYDCQAKEKKERELEEERLKYERANKGPKTHRQAVLLLD